MLCAFIQNNAHFEFSGFLNFTENFVENVESRSLALENKANKRDVIDSQLY